MITLKNGCKARNLQEQVAYNAEEIERLKYLIGDAYLEIDDTALTHTGTITSDMKKVLDAYEIVYVILKQATDLYQVFRTDYYEQKFRKCAFFVGGSLHKLDLDYDNSTWSYSEQSIGGVQVQSDYAQTDTTAVDYIKNKPTLFSGNYNDLTNKPTIPTDVEINASVPAGTTPTDLTTLKKGTDYYSIPTGLSIEYVTLTSASGTISSADLTKLQASKDNKIILDNEIYILMDNKTTDGYLAYSHVEKESTSYKAKTITITISTGAYVQVEQELPLIKVNETLAGTETVLSELTRNNVKYKVENTTEVELWSNPSSIIVNYEELASTGNQYAIKSGTTRWKLEDFDYIVVFYICYSNSDYINTMLSEEIKIINDNTKEYASTESMFLFSQTTANINTYIRSIMLNNISFSIKDAYLQQVVAGGSSSCIKDNKSIIPYKIIGYKYS